MKTQAANWFSFNSNTRAVIRNQSVRLSTSVHGLVRACLALASAAAIVVGASILVSTPGLTVYLQAALWASSFVFLGLAIDLQKPSNVLSLASGVVLPILTDLSERVAVEFAVVAAAVIAAWVAGAIGRR